MDKSSSSISLCFVHITKILWNMDKNGDVAFEMLVHIQYVPKRMDKSKAFCSALLVYIHTLVLLGNGQKVNLNAVKFGLPGAVEAPGA